MIRAAKWLKYTLKQYRGSIGMGGFLRACAAKPGCRVIEGTIRRPFLPHPLRLRIGLDSSDVPTFNKVFTAREYAFAAEGSPKFIIDAGANVGFAAVSFAMRFPEATILAIEPERANFDLLSLNVAPYPNITPLRAALWQEDGELDIADPGRGSWGFTTREIDGGDGEQRTGQRVPAVTVGGLMERYEQDRVDLLKLDIEGAEVEVLESSGAWMHKVDGIIIELHEHWRPGCTRTFYRTTEGFAREWRRGENVFLSRGWMRPDDGE